MPTSITLSWTGDDKNGSGIAYYTVFISEAGGDWSILADGLKNNSYTFIGKPGILYRFKVVATDWAGNVEFSPSSIAEIEVNFTGTVIFIACISAGVIGVTVVFLKRRGRPGKSGA